MLPFGPSKAAASGKPPVVRGRGPGHAGPLATAREQPGLLFYRTHPGVLRLVTSWQTPEDEVDRTLAAFAHASRGAAGSRARGIGAATDRLRNRRFKTLRHRSGVGAAALIGP